MMRATEWRDTVLSEVIDLQRGHDLPAPERRPGNVPILGSFGVTGRHDSARYDGPGVTIGRSGASIGTASYTDLPYWPLNTALFVSNFKGNHPRWVYWLLHLIDFAGYNSGSAQPSLNRNYLKQIPVALPSPDEQRRIAGVLGALDKLIDTNETLITRLRAMQAGAVLQLSQTATSAVSLGAIAAVRRAKASGDAETPYLGLEHFAEGGRGISAIGRLGDVGEGQQSFRKGDLLYGRLRPYFQKVDRAGFDGACTGEIWVVRPTGEIPLTWLTGIMMAPEFTDFAMAGSEGTKMPRAKWDHVARYQVPVPSGDELSMLDSVLEAMWEQIWALQKENEQLRRTRDELLPLLMSGAVRVRSEGVAA